jgi:glycosyltransferase involved in cell wall biosynthesis
LFVGRLKREKGLDLLAAAWPAGRPLQIIGSGPESRLAQQLAGTGFRGPQPPAMVAEAMAQARFVVVCSRVYEGGGLPLVALEALAAGTPVLAPAIGALPDLIAGRGVGWCYPPDKPEALRAAILRAFDEAPTLRGRCLEIVARDHAQADWLAALRSVYQLLSPGSA